MAKKQVTVDKKKVTVKKGARVRGAVKTGVRAGFDGKGNDVV